MATLISNIITGFFNRSKKKRLDELKPLPSVSAYLDLPNASFYLSELEIYSKQYVQDDTFGIGSRNKKRITIGSIDGEALSTVEKRLHTYDKSSALRRFFWRKFVPIEEQRQLFCYIIAKQLLLQQKERLETFKINPISTIATNILIQHAPRLQKSRRINRVLQNIASFFQAKKQESTFVEQNQLNVIVRPQFLLPVLTYKIVSRFFIFKTHYKVFDNKAKTHHRDNLQKLTDGLLRAKQELFSWNDRSMTPAHWKKKSQQLEQAFRKIYENLLGFYIQKEWDSEINTQNQRRLARREFKEQYQMSINQLNSLIEQQQKPDGKVLSPEILVKKLDKETQIQAEKQLEILKEHSKNILQNLALFLKKFEYTAKEKQVFYHKQSKELSQFFELQMAVYQDRCWDKTDFSTAQWLHQLQPLLLQIKEKTLINFNRIYVSYHQDLQHERKLTKKYLERLRASIQNNNTDLTVLLETANKILLSGKDITDYSSYKSQVKTCVDKYLYTWLAQQQVSVIGLNPKQIQQAQEMQKKLDEFCMRLMSYEQEKNIDTQTFIAWQKEWQLAFSPVSLMQNRASAAAVPLPENTPLPRNEKIIDTGSMLVVLTPQEKPQTVESFSVKLEGILAPSATDTPQKKQFKQKLARLLGELEIKGKAVEAELKLLVSSTDPGMKLVSEMKLADAKKALVAQTKKMLVDIHPDRTVLECGPEIAHAAFLRFQDYQNSIVERWVLLAKGLNPDFVKTFDASMDDIMDYFKEELKKMDEKLKKMDEESKKIAEDQAKIQEDQEKIQEDQTKIQKDQERISAKIIEVKELYIKEKNKLDRIEQLVNQYIASQITSQNEEHRMAPI